MSSILIVEDETRIASFIAKGLKAAGFTSQISSLGRTGIEYATHGDFDLIVLDIGLPDMDGFEVLEQLRGQGVDIPVIMLTARTSVTDRVASLELGADDYMAKPFSFEELLARIKVRMRNAIGKTNTSAAITELTYGQIKLNLLTHTCFVQGKEVDLSAREFALLESLIRHGGHVLSREQLLDLAWGYDFDPGSNVVDVYIRYLRAKLGKDRIETVRGMGYRLVG